MNIVLVRHISEPDFLMDIHVWNNERVCLYICIDVEYSCIELIFLKEIETFIFNINSIKFHPKYKMFNKISKILIKNNIIQQINQNEYELTNSLMLKLL